MSIPRFLQFVCVFFCIVVEVALFGAESVIETETAGPGNNTVYIIGGKIFGKKNRTITKWDRVQKGRIYLEGWLTQPVDHSIPHEHPYWQQRYCFMKNSSKGSERANDGPILIFVSGETEMDSRWLTSGEMAEHSGELRSPALFVLEHRFYGQSWPLKDVSVQSLKYLNMDQALNDLAKFVVHVKKTYNFENNKVVLYGGSYGGTLVAYFQQLFPHLAQAGVASSAPINFRFDYHGYLERTAQSFHKVSPECLRILGEGMKHLEQRIRRTKYQCSYQSSKLPCYVDLKPLKVCNALNTRNTVDVQSLNSYITQLLIYFAQYNTSMEAGTNVNAICNAVETFKHGESLGEYEALAKILGQMVKFLYNSDCIEYSTDSFCAHFSKTGLKDGAVVSGVRQWVWQTCSDLGSFPTTNSPHHPFGTGVPPNFFVQQCRCTFGKMFHSESFVESGVQKHQFRFGGLSTSRPYVIYTNGENDPVSGLGYMKLHHLPLNSKDTNELLIIEGGAHCDDLSSYDHLTDSESLRSARNKTLQLIKRWIGIVN